MIDFFIYSVWDPLNVKNICCTSFFNNSKNKFDRPAKVVDKTFDFNPNDAGALWIPGETFRDTQNNIFVKVLKEPRTVF